MLWSDGGGQLVTIMIGQGFSAERGGLIQVLVIYAVPEAGKGSVCKVIQ
jgi:hypothetical protein